MRVKLRVEKKLACDLKPGDIFVMADSIPDPKYFEREMEKSDVALPVLLRTNVDSEGIDDRESEVLKLDPIITNKADEPETRVDPHEPPGMGEFKKRREF